MGKTVTYRLSITPEYELKFTSVPPLQDAHYVICPVTFKADSKLPKGWTLKSTSPKVTLCKELTDLTNAGYWVEEDRGKQTIEGTENGNVTVYAFIEENATDAERDVVLELRPKGITAAAPATLTISQMCPSWNNGLGCERMEDGTYQWGFKWDSSMKVTYDMTKAGGTGALGPYRRWLMYIRIKYYSDEYQSYITYTSWLSQLQSVTIDFSKVPALNVANSSTDGQQNTLDMYNFNAIGDVTGLIQQLEEWGGVPDKPWPVNPAEYASRACAMKNVLFRIGRNTSDEF